MPRRPFRRVNLKGLAVLAKIRRQVKKHRKALGLPEKAQPKPKQKGTGRRCAMSKRGFDNNVAAFRKAMGLCYAAELQTPFLVLLYSLVDAMASLCRPVGHKQVQAQDFENWLATYVLPNVSLPCTAGELYAARCGLLHAHAAESKRSRTGRARMLVYAWGTADPDCLQAAMDATSAGPGVTVAVRIEALRDAVGCGIAKMRDAMSRDKAFAERVYQRADKVFSSVPSP